MSSFVRWCYNCTKATIHVHVYKDGRIIEIRCDLCQAVEPVPWFPPEFQSIPIEKPKRRWYPLRKDIIEHTVDILICCFVILVSVAFLIVYW